MTTKRGLASPWVHSALATTRRSRLQLCRVRQAEILEPACRLAGLFALRCGCGELGLDHLGQPGIPGQAEQEVDRVVLAPTHQGVASKPRIGPQQNAHARPALADAGDDPRHLLDRPGAGVDVGATQFGREQMPAAEHVERQVAVVVVIAVEKAPLLVPEERVVGGVEIERDLRRRRAMGVEEEIDEQGFDRGCVMADLVVARRLRPAQLQPVERRFAGQGGAIGALGRGLAGQHRQHRVVAQLVVVDQVFVAQRDAEHPLPDQGRHRVLDQIRHPAVLEAAGKPLDQPGRPVGRTQQHRPGLRGHRAAVKRRHHRSPLDTCKAKQIRATLCLHRIPPGAETNRSCNTIFSDQAAPMHLPPLRNPG